MKASTVFILGVVALQLGAAISYACRKRWGEAVMFVGAAVANAAVLMIPGSR